MADAGNKGYDNQDMTMELNLDGDKRVTCEIITILTVDKHDYIVLLPLDENGENDDGEVWIYRYSEDESHPDAEPLIEYIDDDDEYEKVSDAFDEYLDNAEFDELIEEMDIDCDELEK